MYYDDQVQKDRSTTNECLIKQETTNNKKSDIIQNSLDNLSRSLNSLNETLDYVFKNVESSPIPCNNTTNPRIPLLNLIHDLPEILDIHSKRVQEIIQKINEIN